MRMREVTSMNKLIFGEHPATVEEEDILHRSTKKIKNTDCGTQEQLPNRKYQIL